MWVHNWKLKKRKLSLSWGFCNESTNQFEVCPLGSVVLQRSLKSKSWCDNPVILQGTFLLESSQVLHISTVISLDKFAFIKTQIIVPQKLDVFDFREIKHNVVTTNSYQFLGSIHFEGTSRTTGCKHPHALFYIITSCLESENEVLQDYLLRVSLKRQVQDIILGYSEPTSTFISRKSINICISGKLNDKIINGEIFLRYQLSTNTMVSWLGNKRCSGVATLMFNKEDVISKPFYIPVNENGNHWILVTAFKRAKLFVSHDPLKTDFKRKDSEINVFN